MGIEMIPNEEDLFSWQAIVKGPKDSPYEKGTFVLAIAVGRDYPFQPPFVEFKTRIFHMNVSSHGTICLNTLQTGKDGWSPQFTLSVIAKCVQSMMTDPNPDSPLEMDIASAYKEDVKEHDRMAYEHTIKHACNNPTATTKKRSFMEMEDHPTSGPSSGTLVGGGGGASELEKTETPKAKTRSRPKPRPRTMVPAEVIVIDDD